MHTSTRVATTLASLTFVLCWAGPAVGQVQGWGTADQTVAPSDLTPTERGGEAYTERWTFSADFEQGGYVDVDYSITNLGFGDRKGTVQISVEAPDGQTYEHKEKVGSGKWSAGPNNFSLSIGSSSVKATSDGFRLLHDRGNNGFDIELERNTPMWQPGRGRLTDDGDFYRFALTAMQADVAGKVRIDGNTHAVTGTRSGLGDYAASTYAPYNLADHFTRFHGRTNGVFVAWRQVQTTSQNSGKAFDWVVVAYKGEIVFSDTQPEVVLAHRRQHSPTGYRVPMGIQIDGRQGSDSIKLVLRGQDFEHRDLLDEYGSVARMVAGTVTNPHQFKVPVEFKLQLNIGGAKARVSGRSEYSVDFMNPRR